MRRLGQWVLMLCVSGICLFLTPVEASITRTWLEAKLEHLQEALANRAANHQFARKPQRATKLRLQMPGQMPGICEAKCPDRRSRILTR